MNVNDGLLSFGGHLEVLRRMLLRVLAVTAGIAAIVFAFKRQTFNLLFAPSNCHFATYRWIEAAMQHFDPAFRLEEFHVDLIATDLSSQFLTHITTALYLGLLIASPYILYEIFRFVAPALYERERRTSARVAVIIYTLFVVGVLMSYFVIFPISFRFLGTYNVAERVHSTITLDSYISTFVTLTLVMGVVFQLPVIACVLGRMGIVNSRQLAAYRRHAILAIAIIAAVITPPDVMSLVLVAIPLYLLYELSIHLVPKPGTKIRC